MIRTPSTLRRATATIALAGAATFGGVALAPAASAAQLSYDGSSYVIDGRNGNGPAAFLVIDQGRKPIFYCPNEKSNRVHKVCQADPVAAPDRLL